MNWCYNATSNENTIFKFVGNFMPNGYMILNISLYMLGDATFPESYLVGVWCGAMTVPCWLETCNADTRIYQSDIAVYPDTGYSGIQSEQNKTQIGVTSEWT